MGISQQRLPFLDALRAFALLGLFLVHMVEYFELHWLTPEPSTSFTYVFLIFGGKAYAMFALLFGVSFALMMHRRADAGIDFRGRFAWRCFLLFGLGYLHGIIYSGDILQVLAVCGSILVLCYSFTNKWLIAAAALCLLQIPLYLEAFAVHFGLLPDVQPMHWSAMGKTHSIYANGSLMDVIERNLFFGQYGKWGFFWETGRFWHVLGCCLLGLVIAKRYLNKTTFNVSANFLWVMAALGLGFALILEPLQSIGADFLQDGRAKRAVVNALTFYQNTAIMVMEIALFAVCYRLDFFRTIADSQAPTGRMSLSFYIAQSLIGVPLFYGFGLALYPSMSHAVALALGCVLWVAQVYAARLWLNQFNQGPLEHLWRRGTNIKLKAA